MRELEILPDKISKLEADIAKLNSQLEDAKFYTRPYEEKQPVLEEISYLSAQLDEALKRWAELETLAS